MISTGLSRSEHRVEDPPSPAATIDKSKNETMVSRDGTLSIEPSMAFALLVKTDAYCAGRECDAVMSGCVENLRA